MLTRSQKIVIAFGGLLYLLTVMLILFHSFTLELYFVSGLIGFLIIVQLLGPTMTRPKWRSRAEKVIMIGLFLFVALVLIKLANLMTG